MHGVTIELPTVDGGSTTRRAAATSSATIRRHYSAPTQRDRQMSLIFISHSSQDETAARELRDRLLAHGFSSEGSLFLDFDGSHGIKAGQDWEQALYRNVRACRAVIVLCSRASMASRWCFMEITHARALGKHLFPVRSRLRRRRPAGRSPGDRSHDRQGGRLPAVLRGIAEAGSIRTTCSSGTAAGLRIPA